VTRRVRSLGVSLKPDRERANITARRRRRRDGRRGGGAGEEGSGKGEGSRRPDGYYLSMEIDLERGRFFAIAIAAPLESRDASIAPDNNDTNVSRFGDPNLIPRRRSSVSSATTSGSVYASTP